MQTERLKSQISLHFILQVTHFTLPKPIPCYESQGYRLDSLNVFKLYTRSLYIYLQHSAQYNVLDFLLSCILVNSPAVEF